MPSNDRNIAGPGRCIKCENPIINGGHEYCQAWARDEILKLRKQVADREDDIKYIEREAREELREERFHREEAERRLQQW